MSKKTTKFYQDPYIDISNIELVLIDFIHFVNNISQNCKFISDRDRLKIFIKQSFY
jgi:hypothetical protein